MNIFLKRYLVNGSHLLLKFLMQI